MISKAATIADWVRRAEQRLEACGAPEPAANAQFLMADCLKTGRFDWLLRSQELLPPGAAGLFWRKVERRADRIPLGYVLGNQPFLGVSLRVGPGVLVPRPSTEDLVSSAIGLLKSEGPLPSRILDIGTGSGAIAIALAKSFPEARVVATDITAAALRTARLNARAAGLKNIRILQEDLRRPPAGEKPWADLVISNPPYIPTAEIASLEPEVRREPRRALDGGPDGLDAIARVIGRAARCLKIKGLVALEMGFGQAERVRCLLRRQGFLDVKVIKDSEGLDRIALARRGAR